MLLDDFDFTLPPELIAQKPADRRDASRLMVVERTAGAISETTFSEIPGFFRAGDLLVVNDTRVIPARLFGTKESGGRIELFLVRRRAGEDELWSCMARCSKPPRPGSKVLLPAGGECRIVERGEDELWLAEFRVPGRFDEWLEEAGRIPLPPYIHREDETSDRERYQTVFARVRGAVAAPTAGLHFTPQLMERLKGRGVESAALTLHVGLGTFMPIRSEDPREHRIHRERYEIPEATAQAVAAARKRGGRVIALGTPTTRALEHAARADGTLPVGEGEADIFIYPGYRFKVIDGLITNFHLPKSTLLLLVSAFAGKELLMEAYREAVERRFRFYSYGDAMFIS